MIFSAPPEASPPPAEDNPLMEDNRLHSSSPSTSESESPDRISPSGGLFTDWFSIEDSKIELGAGLENLGNTCFMNSVLQCFMHTVPLLSRIFSNEQCKHSNCTSDEYCTLCDLKDLVNCSMKWRVVRPGRIFSNLDYFSSNFQKYQQEDAHEFFQCYLDKFQSSSRSISKDCASSHGERLAKEVFGGRILSKLTCCSCGHCSDTYEPSIDLSLEIEDVDTLEAALQSFTKLEKIEDPENKFTCNVCNQKVFVEKQLSFHQTPQVAVFHLKRFKNNGYFGEKIDKHVPFPIDLDLQPFTSGNRDVIHQYSLYAIVVHHGWTSTSGHYYCFIRISQNMWCNFDDLRVAVVDEEYVLSQQAYILFYSREGTPWFSSFSEDHKLLLQSEISNTSPTSVLEKQQTAMPSSPEQEHALKPCCDIAIESEIVNEKEQSPELSPLHDAPSVPTNQQSQNSSVVPTGQMELMIHSDELSDPCISAPPGFIGNTLARGEWKGTRKWTESKHLRS